MGENVNADVGVDVTQKLVEISKNPAALITSESVLLLAHCCLNSSSQFSPTINDTFKQSWQLLRGHVVN